MTELTSRPAILPRIDALRLLKLSGALWFVIAVIGQAAFAAYILGFYGVSTVEGDFERMDGRVFHGFINGDLLGNSLFLSHVLLAFIITFGAPFQLVPQIRNRFRTFHRWNGRLFLLVSLVISTGALVLVFHRGVIGGAVVATGNTINAICILVCAAMTLRFALKRRFADHQRWAMRLFIAASGVWFFRLGFGFWAGVTGGTMPGSAMDLTGPFDRFLGIGHAIIPLLVLELYLLARDRGSSTARYAMAGGMVTVSAATALGIFMAAQIFWLPAFH
ncbi:MAG: DUF2306 domain-containing protein [Henriciella sp.]|uniref:DUF2306 domain-containing protein n=1 Tax=Henriciella sp. TaxID=1968823 RepID=UPI003C720C98